MSVPTLTGASLDRLGKATARCAKRFAKAGYQPVAVGHMFPAETLLDLYGEDLRTRAFLFPGGGSGGELCLRPDFTVPVALAHGEGGWDRPAAYRYQGPVFRRQPGAAGRPTEYLQAGIELLGHSDRARTDAEVLVTVLAALDEIGAGPVGIATGDLGLAFALLDAFEMPDRRRAALRRHFWRPARFHALIERYVAGAPPLSDRRRRLIEAASAPDSGRTVAALAAEAGEELGLRTVAGIAERASQLAAALDDPPMPEAEAALIEAALGVSGPAPEALARLRDLTRGIGPVVTKAVDLIEARLDALAEAGIDAATLSFNADFGRKLEYYDGFVFEITAPGRPDMPLAGGGRYDAMTVRLGAERPVPAVGAMLRPEAALAAADGR